MRPAKPPRLRTIITVRTLLLSAGTSVGVPDDRLQCPSSALARSHATIATDPACLIDTPQGISHRHHARTAIGNFLRAKSQA